MPTAGSAPPLLPLLRAGLKAAILVTVVNGALYGALRATGAWSLDVIAPTGGAIGLPAVLTLSFGAPLLGAALLAGLARVVPYAGVVFVAMALTVYLLFVFPVLDLGAPVLMAAGLQIMNTVALAVGLYLPLDAYRRLRGEKPRRPVR